MNVAINPETIDLILGLIAIEAVILTFLLKKSLLHGAIPLLLLFLASGAALMTGVRVAMIEEGSVWLAVSLTIAGVLHAAFLFGAARYLGCNAPRK